MSEVKPVETTEATSSVAPVVEAAPVVEQPVVEAKPEEALTEAKSEEPVTSEEPSGETTEAPVETPVEVKEVEPIAEGALETKIPVIPLFIKKQTYFFSDDAISEEHLSEYLKKDKTKLGHANYAHATQTGKGLLFSGKEKTKITGIIRIDGAEVTTQGDKKFTIKSAGHELQLEAGNTTLRERWVHTLKVKIAESEGVHATTSESEGYKSILEKLTKPVIVAPVVKKEDAPVVEDKKEEVEPKAEGEPEASGEAEVKKPEGEEEAVVAESSAKVEKKEEKGKRSSSRNRLNRFSFFGKKEEKKEEKKDDEPVAEVKEEGAPTVPEPVAEPVTTAEVAPVAPVETEQPSEPVTETAAIQEPTSEIPAEAKEEEPVKSEETSPVTSPKSNRKSFLGGLFGKKDKKTETPVEESKAEATPEVAPTVEEPTEITEQPATTEPATTEALPDASEPAAVEPETKEEPVEKERERKSSLFGSLRRDKSTDGEDKPRRSLSFWKKEKKVTSPGKEEPAAIVESETDVPPTSSEPVKPDVKAETEETPAAPPVPDVLSTGESSEVRDGKIGDVVPAAITA